MFQELSNQPRPYAWGDRSAIANWQGREASMTPEAELWFGTHPGSEARVVTPGTSDSVALGDWLSTKGHSPSLPFLVKVLAAATPLSIQVHPTLEQAQAGYEAENLAGITLDSPTRNYKDSSDKPEMLIAWSETFDALVGFRDDDGRRFVVETLISQLSNIPALDSLRAAVGSGDTALAGWLFSGADDVSELADLMTERWRDDPASLAALTALSFVAGHFPGDPGIVAACFLNHVTLAHGEALFIPAGIPHAYLQGFGLEVMAPSDNVLRGGLTPKHIDREELLRVMDPRPFTTGATAKVSQDGVRFFAPPGAPFVVTHLEGEHTSLALDDRRVILAVVESGGFEAIEGDEAVSMPQGSGYVGVIEQRAQIQGSGSLFVIHQA